MDHSWCTIHPSMDTWVAYTFGRLWVMLLWTQVCKYLFKTLLSILLQKWGCWWSTFCLFFTKISISVELHFMGQATEAGSAQRGACHKSNFQNGRESVFVCWRCIFIFKWSLMALYWHTTCSAQNTTLFVWSGNKGQLINLLIILPSFPCTPVSKALRPRCEGNGFIYWWGTREMPWGRGRKKIKKKTWYAVSKGDLIMMILAVPPAPLLSEMSGSVRQVPQFVRLARYKSVLCA